MDEEQNKTPGILIQTAIDTIIDTVSALSEKKENTDIHGICIAYVNKEGYTARYHVNNLYSQIILEDTLLGMLEKMEENKEKKS